MSTIFESGECLIRRRKRRSQDKLPVPIQIQLLEPDYLDNSKTLNSNTKNSIKMGIELGSRGQVIAYHVFKSHPGDQTFNSYTSIRIKAENISHGYLIDRPGQLRGVPWLAPVILKIHDHDEFTDAVLLRQKIANCFAGFVTPAEAPETGASAPLSEKMEPGILEVLKPGDEINFNRPPEAKGFEAFDAQIIKSISTGLNIPFFLFMSDYSEVNFSAGRMGLIDFYKNTRRYTKDLIIDKFNKPVLGWFYEAADIALGIDARRVKEIWVPPRREMIDPQKEVPALKAAVRNGFTLLTDIQVQNGYDPELFLVKTQEQNKKIDEKDIIFDSDPRKDVERINAENGGQDAR